jgi:hypothetical protein
VALRLGDFVGCLGEFLESVCLFSINYGLINSKFSFMLRSPQSSFSKTAQVPFSFDPKPTMIEHGCSSGVSFKKTVSPMDKTLPSRLFTEIIDSSIVAFWLSVIYWGFYIVILNLILVYG